ncbi:MAG: hypothetical protein ACFE9X_01425 [Promethearchaeota archaeon]
MNEKEEKTLSNSPPPKIIDSEDKEILEKRPPSEKILYFNLIKNDITLKEKDKEDFT